MAVVFNLNAPLGPQLSQAKNVLKVHQVMLHGKNLQIKRHPKKCLLYLRVLDAREDGASWQEITEIIPPYLQKQSQTARDLWNQATALCFSF